MSNILNQEEIDICEKIANGEESLFQKRAKALLSLNSGDTQTNAATNSGLTVGQVRYTLTKYKALGIAFFPVEKETLEEETISPIEETQEIEPEKTHESTIIKTKKIKTKEKKSDKKKKKEPKKKEKTKKDKKLKKKKIDKKKKNKKDKKLKKKKAKK